MRRTLTREFIAGVIAAACAGETWPAIGARYYPDAPKPDKMALGTFARHATEADVDRRRDALLRKGKPAVRAIVERQIAGEKVDTSGPQRAVKTPAEDIDFGNWFAAHNLTFRSDWRPLPQPERSLTLGGVGSGWMR